MGFEQMLKAQIVSSNSDLTRHRNSRSLAYSRGVQLEIARCAPVPGSDSYTMSHPCAVDGYPRTLRIIGYVLQSVTLGQHYDGNSIATCTRNSRAETAPFQKSNRHHSTQFPLNTPPTTHTLLQKGPNSPIEGHEGCISPPSTCFSTACTPRRIRTPARSTRPVRVSRRKQPTERGRERRHLR